MKWATMARIALRDGQPSMMALGLATGFVGQGADLLILDDPYASPEDAYSSTINGYVHRFWSDAAKPRLNDETNVVVMFHRYTENDLAGWLMENEPDDWELVRYPARADGPYKHPVTEKEYPDPLDREEDEKLSDRFSDEWYAKQKAGLFVWLSQFQGRPTARGGSFFQGQWFTIVGAAPKNALRVRYWDKAGADQDKGDWTVGVLMALDSDGIYYIEDVERFQLTSRERNKRIVQVAQLDELKYGQGNVTIHIEQPPGLAKESTEEVIRQLAGFAVYADPVHKDKIGRAEPLQSQAMGGNVKMLLGEWNPAFIKELEAFPAGAHDDQIDGASGAFNMLAAARRVALGLGDASEKEKPSITAAVARLKAMMQKENPEALRNALRERLGELRGKK
jgi:predicted phage terminase large subunit-like protein